jgi:mevalonate kinase
MTEEIPLAPLPLAVRAPGKLILFGEHAVVHGRPELLLAIDLYLQAGLSSAPEFLLDGDAVSARSHPYLAAARNALWSDAYGGVSVQVVSRIPRAAGLGSSAAFCASLCAGFSAVRGGVDRSLLADRSFGVERAAQGVGSPGDTSAIVAGGVVSVNGGAGSILWELAEGEHRWKIRRVQDPGWIWLVAYSGVPRETATAVRAVGQRLAQPDGAQLLAEFERVTLEGIDAVGGEHREAVGPLMDRNQELLREVGVSHPRLEALIAAVRPVAEGAKLTGAGAGGSIVALVRPGREVEASRRVRRAGGVPYIVRTSRAGVTLVSSGARGGASTTRHDPDDGTGD